MSDFWASIGCLLLALVCRPALASLMKLDCWTSSNGRATVSNSIIEAIQMGHWDFEPDDVEFGRYDSTEAMPGTEEKVAILAERAESGLPLWHPSDRLTFDQ